MILPRFLGIGALKAGTTTLHDLLATHPQVALPHGRKEVMFFDRSWDKGVPWYAAHFEGAGDRVPGEVSPSYLFEPEVPERVHAVVPEARLFAILRDPVERVISQHRFFVKERAYTGDLATFLGEHPNALARSRYDAQLARWHDRFPVDQLHVCFLEDLSADPGPVVARLFTHIGVDPAFVPPNLGARANEGRAPRFPAVYAAGRSALRWLYAHDLGPVVQRLKQSGVRRVFFGGAPRRDAFPPVSDADRQRIRDAVHDDAVALQRRLGRDLTPIWPTLRG